MTNRARVLVLMALVGLCVGTIRNQMLFSLLSLSVIVWILAEWIRFRVWIQWVLPHVQFQRLVNDRAEDNVLWAGRKIQMEVRVTSPSPLRVEMRLRDYVPEMIEIVPPDAMPGTLSSTAQAMNEWSRVLASPTKIPWLANLWDKCTHRLKDFFIDAETPATRQETTLRVGMLTTSLSYVAYLPSAGRLSLPGVRLVLSDMYGLFREHRFREFTKNYRVLPGYYEAGELRPTVKRTNNLPRHGIHRLQRSGMGSELLELREYVPGDPPKSIAWKVSARRDKLLTRQYESEVPVRVHLIVDGSTPTRIGGYGLRLLDQLNYVTASVAQAAVAVGDPVDCLLVDESGCQRLPWFTGDRGMMELLKALADFSIKPPPRASAVTPYMKQIAMTIAHERYPELLDSRYNLVPFTIRGDYRRRFRLVGVLSTLYNLSPREQAACMLSDAPMAEPLQRFLSEAGMPWMAPLLPALEEPTRQSQQRMEGISRAILRSIMHAHDNEVFVILADLLSAAPNLEALARTVKLAVAKHHRVAFVCPTTTFVRPKVEPVLPSSESISDLLQAAERTRVRDCSMYLKRELAQLGASVSFSGEQNAVRMVLAEVDTARSGRSRVQGLRS